MDAVSSAMGSGGSQAKSKGPKIVRIGQQFLTASKSKPAEAMKEFFQGLMHAQSRHVILYIGDFDKFAATNEVTGFIHLLQEALATGMIKCIAGTTRDKYERYIYRINDLKKIFRTVYIHDEFSIPERI
jgi:ATP-dependent Clp protease ATP-binding subunit ClpA